LGSHIAWSAGFASNVLQRSESGYFDAASDSKPLLHLWSLGIEEQFYLVWPLLLVVAWKKRIHLLWLMILVGAASLIFNIRVTRTDAVEAFYSPLTRMWELAAGGALAYLTTHPPANPLAGRSSGVAWRLRARWRHVASIAGLSCIAAALFTFDRHT